METVAQRDLELPHWPVERTRDFRVPCVKSQGADGVATAFVKEWLETGSRDRAYQPLEPVLIQSARLP